MTSLAGGVREACLWSAGLAEPGVTRRATVLDRAEQITDAEPDDCAVGAGRPLDRRPRRGGGPGGPGAALRRAARTVAAGPRHRLPVRRRPARRGAGLRGARPNSTTANAACGKSFRRSTSGAVEILVRGVDVDPDALRLRLKLRGAQRLAVVITRIGPGGAAGRWPTFADRPVEAAGIVASAAPVPLTGGGIQQMRIPTLALAVAAVAGVRLVERRGRVRGAADVCRSLRCGGRRADVPDPGHRPRVLAEHQLPGRLPGRAGRVRLRQADPRRLPQRREDAWPARHALRARDHGHRVQLGGAAARHPVVGVQDVPGRRRRAPADLLPVVQLGSGHAQADHDRHRVPTRSSRCSSRGPTRCR